MRQKMFIRIWKVQLEFLSTWRWISLQTRFQIFIFMLKLFLVFIASERQISYFLSGESDSTPHHASGEGERPGAPSDWHLHCAESSRGSGRCGHIFFTLCLFSPPNYKNKQIILGFVCVLALFPVSDHCPCHRAETQCWPYCSFSTWDSKLLSEGWYVDFLIAVRDFIIMGML